MEIVSLLNRMKLYEHSPIVDLRPAFEAATPRTDTDNDLYTRRNAARIINKLVEYGITTIEAFKNSSIQQLTQIPRIGNSPIIGKMLKVVHVAIQSVTLLHSSPKTTKIIPESLSNGNELDENIYYLPSNGNVQELLTPIFQSLNFKRELNCLGRAGWSRFTVKEFCELSTEDLARVPHLGKVEVSHILLVQSMVAAVETPEGTPKNIYYLHSNGNVQKLLTPIFQSLNFTRELNCLGRASWSRFTVKEFWALPADYLARVRGLGQNGMKKILSVQSKIIVIPV